MHSEAQRGSFSISTDPARLDVDAIHAFLSRSYWAAGIPRSVVERSIAASGVLRSRRGMRTDSTRGLAFDRCRAQRTIWRSGEQTPMPHRARRLPRRTPTLFREPL